MAKGVLTMNNTNEISLEEKVNLLTNLVQTAAKGIKKLFFKSEPTNKTKEVLA